MPSWQQKATGADAIARGSVPPRVVWDPGMHIRLLHGRAQSPPCEAVRGAAWQAVGFGPKSAGSPGPRNFRKEAELPLRPSLLCHLDLTTGRPSSPVVAIGISM